MSNYPVTFYEKDSYGGQAWPVLAGDYPNVTAIGIANDAISGLKVAAFTIVTIYNDAYYGGQSKTFTGPAQIPALRNIPASGGDWNDRTTSFRITQVSPTRDELIGCCTGVASSDGCAGYTPGSSQCLEGLRGYCTGVNSAGVSVGVPHLGDQACQAWCRQNPILCDSAVVGYCVASGKGTSFCSCLNSPAATRGLINPKCVDKACIDTGYLTTNMQQTNCPDVINCTIQTNLANSGVTIAQSTPIQQNCGNSTGSNGGSTVGGTGDGSAANPNATSTITTTGQDTFSLSSILPIDMSDVTIFIGFVVFVALAVALVYAYRYYTHRRNRAARRHAEPEASDDEPKK